jgi:hypothetical protein
MKLIEMKKVNKTGNEKEVITQSMKEKIKELNQLIKYANTQGLLADISISNVFGTKETVEIDVRIFENS